jgi:uncharacterized C2H2 Zn-finger protein
MEAALEELQGVTVILMREVVTVLLIKSADHVLLHPQSFEYPQIWSRRCRIKTLFELDRATVLLLPRPPNVALYTSEPSLRRSWCKNNTVSSKYPAKSVQDAEPPIFVTEKQVEKRLLLDVDWLSRLRHDVLTPVEDYDTLGYLDNIQADFSFGLWKCREKFCEYHEYGLPTEEELDHHINDKHSASPILYKCHYAPCPYNSKRESNCKQHMEKSHGWTYVRSKSNGKNRSNAGDSSLPTPHTFNHQTLESGSHDEPTPEEEDYGVSNNHSVQIASNQNVYGASDDPYFPEYPRDEFMIDANASFAPFISPVESNNQHQSVHLENTSPYVITANNGFHWDNIQANLGTNFGNDNDFQLYEEDVYNATTRVQLQVPSNSVFQQQLDFDTSTASVPVKPEPVPHISLGGNGNAMLYTPTSLGAVDESFEHFMASDHQIGNDSQLFSNVNANMLASNSYHSNSLFGEVPRAVGGLSQSNTQEFFHSFYNTSRSNGGNSDVGEESLEQRQTMNSSFPGAWNLVESGVAQNPHLYHIPTKNGPGNATGDYSSFSQGFSYATSSGEQELARTDMNKSDVFYGECPKASMPTSSLATLFL